MTGRKSVGARGGRESGVKDPDSEVTLGTACTFLHQVLPENISRGGVRWGFSKQSCIQTGSWHPAGMMPAFFLPEQTLPVSTALCSHLHTECSQNENAHLDASKDVTK